uniref:Heterokaryon incompatibility domain-containing protein n=1 Tax=Bionectria ochroleuca TaxID=29856 RepID=A0A8H7KEA7_BIOOC
MPIKKPPPEKSLQNPHPEFDFALKRDTADVDYIPRIEGGYIRAGLHRPTRPSTGLPPYQYSPLPSSSEYVRCLVLQPGRASDDVVISLEPIRLEGSGDKSCGENKTAPFEALSYTWGTSRRDRPITCEGGEIFVTRSLDLALRRLRRSTGPPRRLWADSICINQADPDEKGAQVALMGDIYLRAERVLIYLGAHDYNLAKEAISLISDINTTKLLEIASKDDVAIPFAQNDDPIIADERWKAFFLMLRQIWFTRGWTIQEAWLAQNAVVLWGENDLEVPWLDLVRAYLWVKGRAANAGLGLRHDLTMAEVHRTMFARARPAEAQALGVDDCDGSFLELLEQARVVAMTDPRDRIYAFLSLAAAAGEENNGSDADLIRTIQPNYKDSFHHAYLEFARSYVRSSRDGRLLHHVVHDDETLTDAQLPSWVPRWNIGYYNSRIPMGPTCMTVDFLDLSPVVSQPETSTSSDTDSSSTREWCLKTHGVLMDTVTSVLSLPAPEALDIGEHIVPLLASAWFDLEEAVEEARPWPTHLTWSRRPCCGA